jgi:hypothetical protein
MNLISPEILFNEFYGEFVYVPIKLFWKQIQQILPEPLYNDEVVICDYYLQSFDEFLGNYFYSRDDFFNSFYFLIYKLGYMEDFKSFLELYFKDVKYSVNIEMLKCLQNKRNILLLYELPTFIEMPLFEEIWFASRFIGNEYKTLVMKNYRPESYFLKKLIEEKVKDDEEVNIFCGGTNLQKSILSKLHYNLEIHSLGIEGYD